MLLRPKYYLFHSAGQFTVAPFSFGGDCPTSNPVFKQHLLQHLLQSLQQCWTALQAMLNNSADELEGVFERYGYVAVLVRSLVAPA